MKIKSKLTQIAKSIATLLNLKYLLRSVPEKIHFINQGSTSLFNIETPVLPKKIIHTVDELDLVLKELDAAILISDDALRSTFNTFEMKILSCFSHDPFSDEYKQEQSRFTKKLQVKVITRKMRFQHLTLRMLLISLFLFIQKAQQRWVII